MAGKSKAVEQEPRLTFEAGFKYGFLTANGCAEMGVVEQAAKLSWEQWRGLKGDVFLQAEEWNKIKEHVEAKMAERAKATRAGT
jgi:hypothetical protein